MLLNMFCSNWLGGHMRLGLFYLIPKILPVIARIQEAHDGFRRPNIPRIRRRFFQHKYDSKRPAQCDRHDLIYDSFVSTFLIFP